MKKTRVLLVDDEAAFTTLCSIWLEESGYFVTRAENCGSSVLATARSFRPELIFLDMHLPDKTGLEIAAELQADHDLTAVPVVLLTGALTNEEAAERRMRGMPAVAKPEAGGELVQAAIQFLGERAPITIHQ